MKAKINPIPMITRRSFLVNGSLAAFASRTSSLFAAPDATSVVVRAPSGALRGESVDGVRVFRGVPFAEPPVGSLRFLPTVKVNPWKGERDATKFSAAPMQRKLLTVPHSEDCLYLNIWTPEGSGPFPVFVWIHGGGFTDGYAFEPTYDGTDFAREGIISISVEYRLGVFGFLDLGPILGEQYAGTANNGLHDVMTALSWIQENIGAFGGDPARVTIGGESAGAKLTDILMGIPSAQPLFHQMISQSGGAERVWARAASANISKGLGDIWQRQSGSAVTSVKTATGASLIQAQQRFIETWPQ